MFCNANNELKNIPVNFVVVKKTASQMDAPFILLTRDS